MHSLGFIQELLSLSLIQWCCVYVWLERCTPVGPAQCTRPCHNAQTREPDLAAMTDTCLVASVQCVLVHAVRLKVGASLSEPHISMPDLATTVMYVVASVQCTCVAIVRASLSEPLISEPALLP